MLSKGISFFTSHPQPLTCGYFNTQFYRWEKLDTDRLSGGSLSLRPMSLTLEPAKMVIFPLLYIPLNKTLKIRDRNYISPYCFSYHIWKCHFSTLTILAMALVLCFASATYKMHI